MLQQLSIRNYAIIREVDVDLRPGLNIVTGETGAGKSIVVEALGLVLGERADSSVLGDRSAKCTVEAHIRPADPRGPNELLQLWEIDTADDEVILRREIGPNGKSRAFINDTPVNLTQLRQLASLLVDLHQQFDAMEIGEHSTQFKIIDALAGNGKAMREYARSFQEWQQDLHALGELRRQQDSDLRESDYTRFLFDELEELDLKEDELENLDAELLLMEHAEEVRSSLSDMVSGLQDGERPVLPQLKSMLNGLAAMEKYHGALPSVVQRLRAAYIELQDIAGELGHLHEHISSDGERLAMARDRIDKGNKMLRKHGVRSTADLMGIREGLRLKLDTFQNRGDEISILENRTEQRMREALELAGSISARRAGQVKGLEEKVAILLKRVGMPSASVKVRLAPAPLNAWGVDEMDLLFDANKSGRFEPVQKIASGGELSRLMLVLKSIVAGSIDMPTLIFDEIDSGISGEAARQVGMLMKELAERHQVVSITHQPQIAARADAHFLVYKKEGAAGIETQIRQLDDDGRVDAIAHMLGGERPTAIVLENAREMVKE
jgi:DNA repair protein RecN (Recombination protein N)